MRTLFGSIFLPVPPLMVEACPLTIFGGKKMIGTDSVLEDAPLGDSNAYL